MKLDSQRQEREKGNILFAFLNPNQQDQGWKWPCCVWSVGTLKYFSRKNSEKISTPTFGCLLFKSQFPFMSLHIHIIACFQIFRNIVNICAEAINNGFASIIESSFTNWELLTMKRSHAYWVSCSNYIFHLTFLIGIFCCCNYLNPFFNRISSLNKQHLQCKSLAFLISLQFENLFYFLSLDILYGPCVLKMCWNFRTIYEG